MEELKRILDERIMVIAGGMNMMLQQLQLREEEYHGSKFVNHPQNLKGNEDILSLTQPQHISKLYEDYLKAGADFIETNTFNSNAVVQADYGLEHLVKTMNTASAQIAKQAADEAAKNTGRKRFVAGSIGPTSKSLSIPFSAEKPERRNITFDELVEAYSEQVKGLLDGGVDVLMLKAVFDTANAKAALYAIDCVFAEEDYSSFKGMPVFINATINKNGRTLCGQTEEAFVISVSHSKPLCLGIDGILGIKEMRSSIERMSNFTDSYTICFLNASSTDELRKDEVTPEMMSQYFKEYAARGLVNIVGGGCGTTPEHIRVIANAVSQCKPRTPPKNLHKDSLLLSSVEAMVINKDTRFTEIGQRCFVRGSKRFAELVRGEKLVEALDVAKEQIDKGAKMLEINVDDGMVDGMKIMPRFLNLLSSKLDLAKVPLLVSSSNFDVIEAGLKCMQGKCIANFISLKDGEEAFIKNAKIVKRLGAALVVMSLDESNKQATSIDDKFSICKRSYDILTNHVNFDPNDIIFDPSILSIGTGEEKDNDNGVNFIGATTLIKEKLPGCRTIGGISCLSFSFRGMNAIREAIHSVFLDHAILAGLDMAVMDVGHIPVYDEIDQELVRMCKELLWNTNPEAKEKLLKYAENKKPGGKKSVKKPKWRNEPVEERISYALIKGIDKFIIEDIDLCLADHDKYPEEQNIIEGPLLNGMTKISDLFGSGNIFLPQVLKSAKVMNKAVNYLIRLTKEKAHNDKHTVEPDDGLNLPDSCRMGTVVMATVKSDAREYDVGKNIVSTMLESMMYKVIDLGFNTPCKKILDTAVSENADIVGLNCSITLPLEEMIKVASAMEKAEMKIPLLIGGAGTSATHTAVKIAPCYSQPTIYVSNAAESVVVCSILLNPEKKKEFIQQKSQEYEELREKYEQSLKEQSCVSLQQSREAGLHIDWNDTLLSAPSFTGTQVYCEYDIETLIPYIKWKPLFDLMQMKGNEPNQSYPNIFKDKSVGAEALRVFNDAETLLRKIKDEKLLQLKGIVGFYPANSVHDDIFVYKEDVLPRPDEPTAVLHGLRQQEEKESGVSEPYYCLSDFIAPLETGKKDYIGMFVVSCHGAAQLSSKYEGELDDYKSIMVKAVANFLAEAFAEVLHEKVRKQLWGYARSENIPVGDLHRRKYQGIRASHGGPTQPDNTEKKTIWDLMGVEQEIGIKLTESLALSPAASLSGLYFSHQKSTCFSLGKINKDQVQDYAARKKITTQQAETYLRPNLSYE